MTMAGLAVDPTGLSDWALVVDPVMVAKGGAGGDPFTECETFEEAWGYFQEYEANILGIISDIEFPCEGALDRTAGVKLGVSINTIAFHIKHIYEKLQVHSKSEAVAKALVMGLIDI